MLHLLHQCGKVLPDLLGNEDRWESLYVNYHPPTVLRMWTEWEGYRVNLHRIDPCEVGEALFHPHPWPSAIKVLQGAYEMEVGYGEGDVLPPVAARLILPAGSEYEMLDPDGWHSVRPLDRSSYSLMLSGQPWQRPEPKSSEPLAPLTREDKYRLLEVFRWHYPK